MDPQFAIESVSSVTCRTQRKAALSWANIKLESVVSSIMSIHYIHPLEIHMVSLYKDKLMVMIQTQFQHFRYTVSRINSSLTGSIPSPWGVLITLLLGVMRIAYQHMSIFHGIFRGFSLQWVSNVELWYSLCCYTTASSPRYSLLPSCSSLLLSKESVNSESLNVHSLSNHLSPFLYCIIFSNIITHISLSRFFVSMFFCAWDQSIIGGSSSIGGCTIWECSFTIEAWCVDKPSVRLRITSSKNTFHFFEILLIIDVSMHSLWTNPIMVIPHPRRCQILILGCHLFLALILFHSPIPRLIHGLSRMPALMWLIPVAHFTDMV